MHTIKEEIIKVLEWLICWIENKKPLRVFSLAPVDDLKKDDIYLDNLNNAIQDEKIINIAISGEYGSGKSSIIESFKKAFKNYKTINVSLANFLENNATNTDELEKNILKQLFYKVAQKKIPNSRFVKIRDTSFWKVFMFNILFLCASGPIFIFNNKAIIKSFISSRESLMEVIKSLLGVSITENYINLLIGVLCALSFVILTFIMMEIINKFNLKSIKNSKYVEVELDAKNDEKAFDKYIDELIYFFKRNKYDVVFFEDLDRFDDIKIFTRLRDLNILINDSEEVHLSFFRKKHKVKFVYAIKDDIFFIEQNLNNLECNNNEKISIEQSKNRTKFFDYIIPVIPMMDSNNSYEELESLFEKYNSGTNEKVHISCELKNDISIFIDDTRLLINTFNEFIIYYKKRKDNIKTQAGKLDKLFAIILYKNLYPIDFVELKKQEGVLYSIIENKEKLLHEKSNLIDKLINEKELIIRNLDEKNKVSIDDIFSAFKYRLFKGEITHLMVNSQWVLLDNFSIDDLFRVKDYEQVSISARYSGSININEFLTVYSNNENIVDRINEMKNRTEYRELQSDIKKLETERVQLSGVTLRELINKEENLLDDIEGKLLVKVLLKRGYIGEDYNDYISLFKEGRISNEDNKFLQNISGSISMELDYNLNNVQAVFEKINIDDMDKEYLLNIDIMKYIVKEIAKSKETRNMKRVISQFSDLTEKKIEFLLLYKRNNLENFDVLIKEIALINDKIFSSIYKNESIDLGIKKEIFKILVKKLSVEEILKQNTENVLGKYFLEERNIINEDIMIEENNKLIDIVESLDIKFKELNTSEYTGESESNIYKNNFIKSLYENNLYEINSKMMELIIGGVLYNSQINEAEQVNILGYSELRKESLEVIYGYINTGDNINKYVEKVFLLLDFSGQEEEESILLLMNNSVLKIGNKKEVIKNKKFEINDFNKVENMDIWPILLKNQKVKCCWSNVEKYYSKKSLDNYLVDYLKVDEVISTLGTYEIDNDNLHSEIILSEEIDNNTIRKLSSLFKGAFIKLSEIVNVSEKRVKTLIECKLILLSESIYLDIKKFKSSIDLVIDNIDEYIGATCC
ncbi:MAG: hypothetical protein ACRC6T_16380 [Sarcina sp.]